MDQGQKMFLLLFLLVLWMQPCVCQTVSEVNTLHNSLMTNYKQTIRPTSNQSLPTTLSVKLELYKIIDVDLPKGMLAVVMGAYFIWMDPRLTWNPASNAGITKMQFTNNEIWMPSVMFGPLVAPSDSFGLDYRIANVDNTGRVTLLLRDYVATSCNFNEIKYPYDKHECEPMILLDGYSLDEVVFNVLSSELGQTSYFENAEWALLETSVQVRDTKVLMLETKLTFQRREKYFLVTNFVPVVLLSFLNVLVFQLPVDSGERVGYSITCLLALAVYLTEISNNLPTGSKNMSYISYFLMSMIIFSSVCCAIVIWSIKLYFKDGISPVPLTVKKITLWLQWPPMCFKNVKVNKIDDSVEISPADVKTNPGNNSQVITDDTEAHKCNEISWKDVSLVVDALSFWIGVFFILLVVIVTMLLITT